MARKKNSSFQGETVFEADVGVATFQRTIENAVGDTALVFDKLTGQNSETSLVNHDGTAGHGSLLNIPIVNQYIGHKIVVVQSPGKDTDGGTGNTDVLSYVIFLPDGESELIVEVGAAITGSEVDTILPHVVIKDTSLALIANQPLTFDTQNGEADDAVYWTRFTGLTPGLLLVFVRMTTDDSVAAIRLRYCRIRPRMLLKGSGVRTALEGRPVPSPRLEDATEYGVTTPAATEGMAHRSFDETMFDTLQPLDAYTVAGLNRNLNGLLEYITGWPAGGNESYTHVDHDGSAVPDNSDPARSRFFAHTLSLYGTEPECQFNLWAECFGAYLAGGAFAVNLAEPPTKGCLDWYAPWPIATSSQEIVSADIIFPDFKASSSKLNCAVLIGSSSGGTFGTGDADVGSWSITCATTTGTASATPVHCDSSNTLWLAQISAVPFAGDTTQTVTIKTSRTGSKSGIGELCIIAACLYFDP